MKSRAWLTGFTRGFAALVGVLLLTAPIESGAEARNDDTPSRRAAAAFGKLGAWVKARGGTLGAVVFDLNSSSAWVEIDAKRAMNPASNQKLLTAAAALDLLGPSFRYTTSLHGKLERGKVRALTLVGDGDPSLGVADMWRLAKALEALGVERVEGGVTLDQTRFDERFEPPAFSQQPDEWASFRAPVSAISVNQNTVTLNVLPARAGEAAQVWFEPPGIVSAQGSVQTKAKGSGQSVRFSLSGVPGGVAATLGGHVAEGQPRVRFVRRVADPRLLPGKVLLAILGELGIEVSGTAELGQLEARERLAYLTSAPLPVLLQELGKNSDNFYAETIFKTLASTESDAPAKSELAAERVGAWLKQAGLWDAATKIKNGSGLFDANRVSADSLARLLAKVYLDPKFGVEFVAQLAIGGRDGTLASRFRDPKLRERVRAKTGTLRNVDSLAGYVLGTSGRLPLVFVVLVNGIDDRHPEVRSAIDRAVGALQG